MKKNHNRITKELLETAKGMHKVGILDDKAHEKITMRHLKAKLPVTDSMTSEEIRSLREKAHLSQAVFASYLNLTVGYISQLERGLKEPTGAVLALLNVIRRRGFDIILH
jgi:putative transcriptional regulator